MNRVHEQCPKVYSGTVPSPKTGSNLGQVHSAPTWPSQRAQAAPRPPSRPCFACPTCCCAPHLLLPAPPARLACCCEPHLPHANLRSQYTLVYCDTPPLQSRYSKCISLQSRSGKCIVIQLTTCPTSLLYCNTNFSIAIHFTLPAIIQPRQVMIQWLYRDPASKLTWVVAHFSYAQSFFFFFFRLYFFSNISSN